MTGYGAISGRGALLAVLLMLRVGDARAGSILFVGNSFTYGYGSPLLYYRARTVTDLNGTGLGGVPALFESFAVQAGLDYDVFLETHPGIGLDWHVQHELAVIGRRPWDAVVLQSYSTLDADKPGDPAVLVDSVRRLATAFREKNPKVALRLTATWPRADLTYVSGGAWHGRPIEAMARDIRAGYLAAAASPGIHAVIPVGDAWIRAMHEGVADANPYDGIEAGKMDLWTFDHYHASTYGYYLEALMIFGGVTGRDPRSLGESECSGYELGLSPSQISALQRVAFEQLAADRLIGGAGNGGTGNDRAGIGGLRNDAPRGHGTTQEGQPRDDPSGDDGARHPEPMPSGPSSRRATNDRPTNNAPGRCTPPE